ncbi:hypothetical protein D3C87_1856490 [compost metagenome]
MPCRQKLLEQDRHLDAVRRAERIKLQRVFSDRQFLGLGRAGDRPVDIGKLAAITLFPGPDLGRFVACGEIVGGGFIGHRNLSLLIAP